LVDALAWLIGAIDACGYLAMVANLGKKVDAKVRSDVASLPAESSAEVVRLAETPRTWHLYASRFFVLSFAFLVFYALPSVQPPYLGALPSYELLFYLGCIFSLGGLLFLYFTSEFAARPHSTVVTRLSKIQVSTHGLAAPIIRHSFRLSALVGLLALQTIDLLLLAQYFEASVSMNLSVPIIGELFFTTLLSSFSGAVITLFSLLRGRYHHPSVLQLAGLALVLQPWSFLVLATLSHALGFL
jgi:hypothetical protein